MSEKLEVETLFKNFTRSLKTNLKKKLAFSTLIIALNILMRFLVFLKHTGIQHQSICIDTPQQNKIDERKNKCLLEVSLTIMFFKNVPNFSGRKLF